MTFRPMRVDRVLDRVAATAPGRVALVYGARRWTYGALQAERDHRAACLVEAGLRDGERAIVAAPPSDDLVLTWLACCRANVPLVVLSPQLAADELAALAARAEPAAAFVEATETVPAAPRTLPLALPGTPGAAARAEAARRAGDGDAERPSLLRPTSGTTGGLPKLVVSSHRQFTWRIAHPAWWEEPDGVYCLASEHHFSPPDICQLLGLGATLLVTRTTRPDHLEAALVEHGATGLWVVPTLLHLLAQNPRPVPAGLRLRAIRTSATALPAPIARAADARYGLPVVQFYASTEGGLMTGTLDPATPRGSIGVPLPGVEARIVDPDGEPVPDGEVGELILRPPGLMLGYLGDPLATARAVRGGWLHSGDRARRDAQGYLWIEGRLALQIDVGGYWVAPEEVESVLRQHPGVRDVVVLGQPDPVRGQSVRAVVIPQPPIPTVAALQHFCGEHLARYKVPRQIEFRDELPRSELGKVLRHRL